MTHRRRFDVRPSACGVALAGIVTLAAALRLVGLGYGLPYPLLNPDEASIVPRAWEIAHAGALDPHWYDYPSLLMYVLAPVEALFGQPSYGAARLVAVAIGVAGVAAVWWLGRAAYGTHAGLIGAVAVAVATTHVAYSRMAVTDVLMTLGITCALGLMIEHRLEWAGVAAGLAAATKYPAAILVVPLMVASWGEWRRLLRSVGVAVAAFALASPFVVVHAGAAWDDVSRVQRLARAGWLGFEGDGPTPLAFLDRTWGAMGPLLALSLVGLVIAFSRGRRTDLVLASFAIAYWLYLMPQHAHFDRYVLPLVPVLAVLAGSLRRTTPVALLLLAVPLVWSARDAVALTSTDTRVVAGEWIARHVPADDRIAADPSTLPLAGRDVVRLELPGPNRAFDPRRDLRWLRRQGVRWVLVSGAVTDRIIAASDDYPRERAFYRALARECVVALAVDPKKRGLGGPWVRVYRL